MKRLVGGSFAPPISDEQITSYEAMAKSADRRVSQYMLELVKMLRVFRQTPDSTLPGSPHPVKGVMIPLENTEIERIWEYVPWPEECDVIDGVFASLPSGELRNAAYHLLWFARELTKDREPITADKL
jgi:hypothetical protein